MALENIEYGAKASSEVLNNNFDYLDERITTTNQKLETVNSQIQTAVNSSKSSTDTQISTLNSTLTSTLNSTKSDLQSQINSVKNTANGKLSASFSKNGNGYCKFSNGLIIQWGWISSTQTGTVTFPCAFSSTARLAGTAVNYTNTGSSYIFCWMTLTKTNFSFCVRSGGGNGYAHSVSWIAVGY